jgi:hypothetical protein
MTRHRCSLRTCGIASPPLPATTKCPDTAKNGHRLLDSYKKRYKFIGMALRGSVIAAMHQNLHRLGMLASNKGIVRS